MVGPESDPVAVTIEMPTSSICKQRIEGTGTLSIMLASA